MRYLALSLTLIAMSACAHAAPVKRLGAPEAPIAASVEIPPNARLVYVSGTVPDAADAAAPADSVARYGNTAAQTRSVLRKIEAQLRKHDLGLGDVVMMRVFLVPPPGSGRMDFEGMMSAYREVFGTAAQPAKPARSTVQVAALVNPGWLVEIEVTAAGK